MSDIVIKGRDESSDAKPIKRFLTDEDIDLIVKFLRTHGYKWGVVKGNSTCKVSLYSNSDDLQISLHKDSAQILLLNTNKKYKCPLGDAFTYDEQGKPDFDLNFATEIQL